VKHDIPTIMMILVLCCIHL